MKTSIKQIEYSESAIRKILLLNGLKADRTLMKHIYTFLHKGNVSHSLLKSHQHNGNSKSIKAHNDFIKRLFEYTGADLHNITGITVHTRKGDLFSNNSDLIKKAFGRNKPTSHNVSENINWLKSSELDIPQKTIELPDKDQSFINLIKQSMPLAQYIYQKHSVKKITVQRIVMSLVSEFFSDFEMSASTETRTFKKYINLNLR
jgi:hypothetical protein